MFILVFSFGKFNKSFYGSFIKLFFKLFIKVIFRFVVLFGIKEFFKFDKGKGLFWVDCGGIIG